jgi:PAS domain-containing protein
MRDATAERAYREEVEDARRMRKALGAAAGIGAWGYDPVAETIWWSDELADLVGLDSRITWTPENFFELIHPKDREPTQSAMARAVATGEQVRLEHRVWARTRWMTMRVTVRTERAEGGVFSLKGISEEITELAETRDAARRGELTARKARREAQAMAGRLALALEAAAAGVYEIDHVRQTFWCSPEFERITGQKGSSYEEASRLRYPGSTPTTCRTCAPRSAPCTAATSSPARASRRGSSGPTGPSAGCASSTTCWSTRTAAG